MASLPLESLFCLLPALLPLVLCLLLRWATVRGWTTVAVRAAGYSLWVTMCLILKLPLDRKAATLTEEAGSQRTDAEQTIHEPRLICKPTTLAKYLLQKCGSLARPQLAAWPRGDPHLQTLSSLLCGQDEDLLQFTRDHLWLRDGGIVALDWVVGPRMGEAVGWKGERQSEGRALGCFTRTPPVLLLIPQFWGGTTAHLKLLCLQATLHGFYVVVFHPRGTAGCPLTTARLTEFGDPADLEQAVQYIHSRHPFSSLLAVSEGSGSGTLLSYLGECGSSTYLTAAAAISPVLLGQRWFETAMPPVYRWGALFHRKVQLSRYESTFRDVLDVDRALSCSSLKDFEETLFCSSAQIQQRGSRPPGSSVNSGLRSGPHSWTLGERGHPAKDWDKYWDRNEPLRDADEVAIPVLCICSRDDPLLPPASTLPLSLFQSNPFFLLVLTDKGGHCGFTVEVQEEMEEEKTFHKEVKERRWSHIVILDYFKAVADFLKGESMSVESCALGAYDQMEQRHRTSNVAHPRRRRTTLMRRQRSQVPEQSSVDTNDGNFTWKRSYTR